ncbi:MAG: Mov34/MPN/PAD-1 family protein [Hadesarchaea archaeon]|nr:Mov34/MPN/PAD-1 family protein [Hadesarchaea archaeon]
MGESVRGIDREVLNLILHASRSTHPDEFAGVLRARRGVISEVLFLPGTLSSRGSAVMRLHTMPIDPGACGTVHSHPSSSTEPSEADLVLFRKFGAVHIVVAYPYDETSWQAYDHKGNKVSLEVVEGAAGEGDGWR